MTLVNNVESAKISRTSGTISGIFQSKVETMNSNGFSDIYNNLLNTAKDKNSENGEDSINCSNSYCSITRKRNNQNQCDIDSAKVQAKLELDINRIAKLMGIGPKTLIAIIGELKVDPNNYDFKIQTNVDEAVNSVAAYFGISPMTMLAVFKKLDIDPNDLEDKKKAGKIICKLQEFFKLDVKQEKELSDILAKFIRKDK